MPLLISSIYNKLWEYINIEKVTKAMKKKWLKNEFLNVFFQPLIKLLLEIPILMINYCDKTLQF